MDLIYQNANGVDQGVMKHYEMDLAYGRDENDFELMVDADNHCLEKDYILYIEGTEYGGIVDAIQFSNIDNTITYTGRTWHGILEGKIFEVEDAAGYLWINGNANDVLKMALQMWNLGHLFRVDEQKSSIEIINYKIGYEKGYTGLRKMLFEFGGKLKMTYKDGYMVLSAEPYMDYSQDEEFDSSQVYFTAKKNYRPLNHLVCTGLGEQNERYTIHLFCDEYGGLQMYAFSDVPVKDSDYILSMDNRKLFGAEEVSDVIDCGSVQVVENYVLLYEKPENWETDADIWNETITDIYLADEEGKMQQAKAEEKTLYELQQMPPYDWNEKYRDYYVLNGEEFEKVSFEEYDTYDLQKEMPFLWSLTYEDYYCLEEDEYRKVKSETETIPFLRNLRPSDWARNYGNYYEQYSDGTTIEYRVVSGVAKYQYKKQESKPSDWESAFSSYYRKSGKKYIPNQPKYEKQSKKPTNWTRNYSNYYQRISDGTEVNYRQVSAVTKNSYELQTQKPSDWSSNYNQYYEKNEKGKYVVVSIKNYVALTEQPSDWDKKYADYFYVYSDGTKSEYRSIPGVTNDVYTVQTTEPTDWITDYDKYYYFDGSDYKKVEGVGEDELETAPVWSNDMYFTRSTVTNAPSYSSFSKVYRKGDAPSWKKETYYTKKSEQKAPSYDAVKPVYAAVTPRWNACARYTKTTKETAPEWKYDTYYELIKREVAPEWKKNKYYTRINIESPQWVENTYYTKLKKMVAPVWDAIMYYRKHLDHYAGLVEKGIEYLNKNRKTDELSINLEPDIVYDINDIIGANDNITKQSVWMPITKKIVKITENTETVEYEVGE